MNLFFIISVIIEGNKLMFYFEIVFRFQEYVEYLGFFIIFLLYRRKQNIARTNSKNIFFSIFKFTDMIRLFPI